MKFIYLIVSNILLFILIQRTTPPIGNSPIPLYFALSMVGLNFALLIPKNLFQFDIKKLWFVFSEWLLGFLIIQLTPFLSVYVNSYILYFILSMTGGILTVINFSKTFKIEVDYKKYVLGLILISIPFLFIEQLYFSFIYQRKHYDLSIYTAIPQIFMVLIWQVYHLYFLTFKISRKY